MYQAGISNQLRPGLTHTRQNTPEVVQSFLWRWLILVWAWLKLGLGLHGNSMQGEI